MLQLTTIFFLIAFSTLAVIHYLAMKMFLYWRFPWFDIPMHIFGGAVVALGLYTLRDLHFFPSKLLRPVPILMFVLVVALAWEVFEYFSGIKIEGNYFIDTGSDLLFGLIGGFVGYFVGNNIRGLR